MTGAGEVPATEQQNYWQLENRYDGVRGLSVSVEVERGQDPVDGVLVRQLAGCVLMRKQARFPERVFNVAGRRGPYDRDHHFAGRESNEVAVDARLLYERPFSALDGLRRICKSHHLADHFTDADIAADIAAAARHVGEDAVPWL